MVVEVFVDLVFISSSVTAHLCLNILASDKFNAHICVKKLILERNFLTTSSSETHDTDYFFFVFYPTALKGCWGIVFTHGVRMGGRAGGGKKFVRAVSQKP